MSELSISERMKPIDGLRGIGAIAIALFFHYRGHLVETTMHPLYRFFPLITEWGWIFVEMFFMISGMSFYSFYFDRIKENKVTPKSFFVSRFSRLYPVYILALIIVSLFQLIRAYFGVPQFIYVNNNFYNFLISVFFLQGCGLTLGDCFNGVAWTACVEGILYIVFFIISRKAKCKADMTISAFCGIIIGYTIELLWDKGIPLINFNMGRGFVAFFAGILVVQMLTALWKYKEKGVLCCYAFLFLLIICVISKKKSIQFFGPDLHCVEIFTFVAFPCVFYLVTEVKILRMIFKSKLLNYLGKLSYCIYMLHFPIQLILDTINKLFEMEWDYSKLSFWIIYSIITISFSIIIHEIYEGKMRKGILEMYG